MKQRSKKKQLERAKLQPKSSRNPSAEISIEIGLPSQKLADTICTSLLPETEQPHGFRSRTTVSRRGRVLRLEIKADDIVALRAASNSFLRFVSVAMKTLNVVAPFYTSDKRDSFLEQSGS